MRIRPRTDNIFCINADFGDTVTGAGIIIKKTLGTESGVTPRWMEVFDVGPDILSVFCILSAVGHEHGLVKK